MLRKKIFIRTCDSISYTVEEPAAQIPSTSSFDLRANRGRKDDAGGAKSEAPIWG